MKLTITEHISACAVAAKNYTSKLIGELAGTVAGALEELEGKLKQVAFSGSYNDLTDKPTSMKNPSSLTLTVNGSSSSYNGAAAVSKSFYAPTSYGTSGYRLVGMGSGYAPVWQALPYATCSTSAATTAKTASVSNFKLLIGAIVRVKFTYSHTGTIAATLNVNSTGAKTIVVNVDGTNTNITKTFAWGAGEIVTFLYDGTNWVAIDSNMGFVHPTSNDIKTTAVAVTIPASGWSTDTSVSDYPYYYDISSTAVTANDCAAVMIAPSSQNAAITCGLCPTNETLAGKIRIRSTKVPTEVISAEYRIEQGKES